MSKNTFWKLVRVEFDEVFDNYVIWSVDGQGLMHREISATRPSGINLEEIDFGGQS